MDLIFARIVPKGHRRISLSEFEEALWLIAERLGVDYGDVLEAVALADFTHVAGIDSSAETLSKEDIEKKSEDNIGRIKTDFAAGKEYLAKIMQGASKDDTERLRKQHVARCSRQGAAFPHEVCAPPRDMRWREMMPKDTSRRFGRSITK